MISTHWWYSLYLIPKKKKAYRKISWLFVFIFLYSQTSTAFLKKMGVFTYLYNCIFVGTFLFWLFWLHEVYVSSVAGSGCCRDVLRHSVKDFVGHGHIPISFLCVWKTILTQENCLFQDPLVGQLLQCKCMGIKSNSSLLPRRHYHDFVNFDMKLKNGQGKNVTKMYYVQNQ